MKNILLVTAAALGVFILTVLGITLVSQSPIPKDIVKQSNLVVFYPSSGDSVALKKDTVKYDAANKQVSFLVEYAGRQITFAEQSSPEQFTDIPEYFPKFLAQMNDYSNFENANGKVFLTQPKDVKTQVAVMNSKGTLLFAKTDKNCSTEEWKRLFSKVRFVEPR